MNWNEYLRPAEAALMHSQRLSIATAFPADNFSIQEALSRKPTAVLLGLPYYQRGEKVYWWPQATRNVRKHLYRLALPTSALYMVDIGDIYVAERAPKLLFEAIETLTKALIQEGHTVILFGGGQEAAHPLYRALAAQETPFVYALIDKKLDLIDPVSLEEMPHRSYHRDMLIDEEVSVSTWGHIIGLAWHWLSPEEESLIHEKLHMLYVRLHELAHTPDVAEPLLRMTALISLDLGVIRGADMPAVLDPEVEGVPIEIASKLMRFAGMGYRSEVLHIANYFPKRDMDGRTAAGIALLIWYFLEGRMNPCQDFPKADRSNLQKYIVPLPHFDEVRELVFYRHPISGRWWLEIPLLHAENQIRLVPCSQQTYEEALAGEIPRIWYALRLCF
ncbi:MAG: arginase family protein [Bacteroidia bacterium]|nr:arginase family protein [Bacteroidia bacterium]MDW8134609.1 arginase family protein [Bacteroidia bacterium]